MHTISMVPCLTVCFHRLIAVDNAEAAKRRREEARNNLEAYLYRIRDLLEDEETNPFKRCSKKEERDAIQEKLEETLLWMHEYADDAQTIDFWDKKNLVEYVTVSYWHGISDSCLGD